MCKYDSFRGQITITSQASGFPSLHGRRVRPSGRLLSGVKRPLGSLLVGMPAGAMALVMMSLNASCCLMVLPAARLPTKLCTSYHIDMGGIRTARNPISKKLLFIPPHRPAEVRMQLCAKPLASPHCVGLLLQKKEVFYHVVSTSCPRASLSPPKYQIWPRRLLMR